MPSILAHKCGDVIDHANGLCHASGLRQFQALGSETGKFRSPNIVHVRDISTVDLVQENEANFAKRLTRLAC